VLRGQSLTPAAVTGDWFVNALMAGALGEADALGRNNTGAWTFRFRSTHPLSVARHKLENLHTPEFFDEIIDEEPSRVKLRRYAAQGLFGRFAGGKKSGFEVEVLWPGGRTGEIELTARLFGDPDAKFSRATAEAMPRLFNEIRSLLQAGDERRKDPRIPAQFELTLFPLKDDGEIYHPVNAKCRNVSAGGLAFCSVVPIPTRYVYVEFNDLPGVAGLALLAKLIRSQPNGIEHIFAARYRVDL
jgi:hypothetical protein